MKVRSLKRLGIVIPILAGVWGCGDSSTSQLDSVIPGDNPFVGDIGYAYDSGQAVILPSRCIETHIIPSNGQTIKVNGDEVKDADEAQVKLQQGKERAKDQYLDGKFVGQKSAELHYKSDLKYQEMVDALNGSLAMGISAGGLNVGAGAVYAKHNAAKDYSITKSIIVAVKGGSKQASNIERTALTSRGREAKREPQKARIFCGDEFISQIDYGALFIATLTIELANLDEKEAIEGYIDAKIAGVVNVQGELQKLSAKLSGKESIKLDIKQLGGDPTLLGKIFKKHNFTVTSHNAKLPSTPESAKEKAKGVNPSKDEKKPQNEAPPPPQAEPVKETVSKVAILACGLKEESFQACMLAFDDVFEYASGSFLRQLNLTTGTGLVPILYHTTNYQVVGDPFRQAAVDESTKAFIDTNRRIVFAEMNQVEQDIERINWLERTYRERLSSRQVADLITLRQAAMRKLGMISSANRKCFSGIQNIAEISTACEQSVVGQEEPVGSGLYPNSLVNQLAEIPYNRAALVVVPESFKDWCLELYDGSLSEKSAITVRHIINRYGNTNYKMQMRMPSPTDKTPEDQKSREDLQARCKDLSDRFAKEKNIILEEVANLEPLISHRAVETLEVSAHNQGLVSLTPLQSLSNLKSLRLSGPITNLTGLEGARELHNLSLVHTNITHLGSLAHTPQLFTLKVVESDIEDLENLNASKSLRKISILANHRNIDSASILPVLDMKNLDSLTLQVDSYFSNSTTPGSKVTREDLIEACQKSPKVKKCEDRSILIENGKATKKDTDKDEDA